MAVTRTALRNARRRRSECAYSPIERLEASAGIHRLGLLADARDRSVASRMRRAIAAIVSRRGAAGTRLHADGAADLAADVAHGHAAREEAAHRVVRLSRQLDLGYVAAVELELTSVRQRFGDVARKGARDEPVALAPDEQRIGTQIAQPCPEAVRAVGLLEVDVARGGVEGGAAGRREVRAQELVDAGCRPSVLSAGHDAVHDRLDDWSRGELHEPQLRAHQLDQRRPGALPTPRQRGTEQRQALDAAGVFERDLQRDAPAETVSDEVRAVELERVEQRDHGAREEAGVVARPDRLDRIAEAR